MATFYLDPEGGNDANDGTTFANRWKTLTSGATAARTAPGDTIRIKGSPNPTSLGVNGVWTSGKRQATISIVSSTNATPIVVTTAAHGYSTGQTVQITGHTTNTNANGTWEITVLSSTTFSLDTSTGNGVGGASGTVRDITNSVVMLASAVTADICDCETAWTASANVTATVGTPDCKQNKSAASLAIAAGFTTGKAAYFATGTLNLSGYEQVSFWIKQTAGTVAIAGDVSIRLCTDTAGAVSVHTVAIPALGQLSRWIPFTVNIGGALNSAIASVALYVDTDRGAQTFLIDNIIAVKSSSSADSLSLWSLIGKNSAGEYWWPIQSITGRRVILDNDTNVNTTSTSQRGYYGVSGTVATYKRETLKVALGASGTSWGIVQESGTSGSLITYEGGWDDVAMSTKNMETWIDGLSGGSVGVNHSAKSFIRLNSLRLLRFSNCILANSSETDLEYDDIITASALTAGVQTTSSSSRFSYGTQVCYACNGSGFQLNAVFSVATSLSAYSIVGSAGVVVGTRCVFDSVDSGNNGIGVSMSGQSTLSSLSSDMDTNAVAALSGIPSVIGTADIDNATSAFQGGSGAVSVFGGTIGPSNAATFGQLSFDSLFRNVMLSDSVFITSYISTRYDRRAYIENKDGVAGDHRIYAEEGLIQAQTAVRHTASGLAWSFAPTSATVRYVDYPLNQVLGPFYGVGGVALTVTCWFYRTDTGLTGRLVAKAPQPGVTSDVVDSMSGSAGAWEQLSVTFTPSTDGAYYVEAQFYGGTTYIGYIDDLEITQGGDTYTLPLDKPFNAQPFLWNSTQAGGGGGGGSVAFSPFTSPVIRGVA